MERAQDRRVRIIDDVEAARALFAPAFDGARDERLYVAHLNAGNRLLGLRIHYASRNKPVVFPVRSIISDAMSLGSGALVLAHNHPSGDPTPSATDIETTRRLVQVARPIGIIVRDHLVFGDCERFVSFRQHGLL